MQLDLNTTNLNLSDLSEQVNAAKGYCNITQACTNRVYDIIRQDFFSKNHLYIFCVFFSSLIFFALAVEISQGRIIVFQDLDKQQANSKKFLLVFLLGMFTFIMMIWSIILFFSF